MPDMCTVNEEEKFLRKNRAEAWDDGRKALNCLYSHLVAPGRMKDVIPAFGDPVYLQKYRKSFRNRVRNKKDPSRALLQNGQEHISRLWERVL